jgi:group I intron endonuclease
VARSEPTDTGIYAIRNVQNGNLYIGSALRFGWRTKKHRLYLDRGTHHSPHLQRAWKKYGSDAFRFELLLRCRKDDLIFFEQRAIDSYKPEYNICRKAGSCLGVKRSEEFKRKLREKGAPYVMSEDVKKRISASLKGRPHGRTVSDEVMAKMAAHMRTPEGQAHLNRLHQAKVGVPRPDHVRHKLSLASARYSADQVRQVRLLRAAGEKLKDIARTTGISKGAVQEMCAFTSYRWVT